MTTMVRTAYRRKMSIESEGNPPSAFHLPAASMPNGHLPGETSDQMHSLKCASQLRCQGVTEWQTDI